jgi:ketosteroid isomerase-like protein
MKRWLLVIVLVVPVVAQDAMRAEANAAAEGEVRKVEMDLAQMMVHGDWDQYSAHLMDDYAVTDRNGVIQDKVATITVLREREKILDLAPEDLKIRVYGDTAIVTGHFTLVQRRNGRVDTFFTRQTDVFLRRGGRWMLAASHATNVAK